MTETTQETPTEGGESAVQQDAELQQVVSKLDDDGSNPFWPKGAGGPGQPDVPNLIDIVSVEFGATAADVVLTIKTTPVDQAWSVNWGEGGADVPVAAATNVANHHYADTTAGKLYVVKAVNGTDTDTRNVQY